MGVTDRTMRRWRERLNKHGYSGLWDYRKRSPSPKRVPRKTVEQVLQLYREKYFDFNVQHFHEKLCELHGIELSYSVLSLSASALLSAAAPDAKQELDAGLKAAESYDWPSAAPHLRYAQLHLALADQRDRTLAHILFLRSTTGNR